MGLETATYINELNETWPLDDDFIREADDHMRLIKSTIKNTFPNITGEVTTTQAELNLLVGQTSFPGVAGIDEQVQYNSSGNFAGSSNLVFDGTTLTANQLIVSNLTTLGVDDIDPEGIVRGGDQGSIFISGGTSQTVGAHLTMYGESNGSVPGNIAFTVGTDDDLWVWDDTLGQHTFNKGVGAVKELGILLTPTELTFNSDVIEFRSSEAGDPTAGGTITVSVIFESSDPNGFGEIGYLASADALDIRNYAYDADVNIYATDGTSLKTEYGITLNSQALAINLDVNLFPETLMDFDSSGATVVTDAAIQMFTYIKEYPDAGGATDGYALVWNDANGRLELTAVGGGGGTPGGADTQLQFNNAGSFGGAADLTWDGTQLEVGGNGGIKYVSSTAFPDQGRWDCGAGNAAWSLNAVDDAEINFYTALSMTRTGSGAGISVQSIDFQSSLRFKQDAPEHIFDSGTLYIEEIGAAQGNKAGYGQLWVNSADDSLNYTTEAGVNFDLTAGGGGAPGGLNTYVQFNDGGSFGGSADFTWDGSTLLVNADIESQQDVVIGSSNMRWRADSGQVMKLVNAVGTTTTLSFQNSTFTEQVSLEARDSGEFDVNGFLIVKNSSGVMYAQDSNTAGSAASATLGFRDSANANLGSIGFNQGTGVMRISTEPLAGGSLELRPNDAVELFDSGSPAARTVPQLSGGLEVFNTATGAGYERVLTTSDLGGGGSPGGADTEVQYNNGGAFGGMGSAMTYNDTNSTISFGATLGATLAALTVAPNVTNGTYLNVIDNAETLASGTLIRASTESSAADDVLVDIEAISTLNTAVALRVYQGGNSSQVALLLEGFTDGSPRMEFRQLGTERASLQYLDSTDHFVIDAFDDIEIVPGNNLTLNPSGQRVNMQSGHRLYMDGGLNTWIEEDIADNISIFAGGFERLRVGSTIFADVQTVTLGDTTAPADFLMQLDTDGGSRNNRIRFRAAGTQTGQIGYVGSFDQMVLQGPVQTQAYWDDDGFGFSRAIYEDVEAVPASDINIQLATFHTKTITANTTFTFSNPPASGTLGQFTLELTDGGAFTVNWPASVEWPGGTAPTLTASGKDIISFITTDGGTSWQGFVGGLDFQ